MPFVVGAAYSRDHIHNVLGGETVSYLPWKNHKIVCGCFSIDRNPEAPYTILVGGSPGDEASNVILKKARTLVGQAGAMPVFMKHASNHWVFDGYYRVKGYTQDREVIRKKQAAAGRDDVIMVLYLEAAETHRFAYLLTWNPDRWHWDNLE